MLSMMSASTVDAAVERTCVGNTHGPHRPVSAISRGRRGRWWCAAARTAAAGAALRNAREDSVTVMYHYLLLGTSQYTLYSCTCAPSATLQENAVQSARRSLQSFNTPTWHIEIPRLLPVSVSLDFEFTTSRAAHLLVVLLFRMLQMQHDCEGQRQERPRGAPCVGRRYANARQCLDAR